jgi:F0F1-type ATP synthase alpha subunit
MTFTDQVIAIYAGTRGYLDKLAVSDILPYQEALVAHVKTAHPGILDTIAKEGAISSDTDSKMKDIFTKFTAEFASA